MLRAPHVSEKRLLRWKKQTPSFSKLLKTRPKQKSKLLCRNCFEVEVEVVNTLVVKGKVKRHGQRIGRRSDWKKLTSP
ncbi:50S ribosomal protein L23 [Klebsiella pneumoniae subsp. pneumoniae]|nr:50S ribosomal protein L23 [Klebsiella pneumoniae subsp. pneumoniae]